MYEPIDGWPLSSFLPGAFGQNKWGRGKASVGQFVIVCGLTGTKTAAGSMTADSGGEQSFSLDQSVALCGPRSTAVQQAKAAFTVDGVSIVHLPPAEAIGAAGAHINIAFGGTWGVTGVTSGSVFFWVNNEMIEVVVGSSDDTADASAAAELAFGSNQNLPVTAANGAAALTGTVALNGLSYPTAFGTNTFTFIIDGVAKNVTFSSPAAEADVVTQINAVLLTSATASLSSHFLVITSATTGTSSSVVIQQGTLLAATIGFTEGQTSTGTSTLVLTCDSKGTQGNSYLLAWDLSQAPTGLTVTVTGGTAIHSQLVPFTGGTGTESLTNVLAANETAVIDFWGVAQTDTSNAAIMKAFVESQAGPMIQHLESAHFGHNGSYAAATTFASTTLNHVQCVLGWERNCETHPAVIAANMAALRSSMVGANPNKVYAGLELKGVGPQRYEEDKPGLTEQDAALHAGVTVVMQATKGSPPVIVRDVVSKCLTGTTPNYNTLGWPHVDVPFTERKQFAAEYLQRRLVNPSAGPDPLEGEAASLPGKETPRSLQAAFTVIKKTNERAFWVRDVDANPVQVWWDYTRNCLMYYNPCLVGYQNLQVGGTTAQTV
jgi:phage tail sheath gpL-like